MSNLIFGANLIRSINNKINKENKMPLFEVAILERPTSNDEDNGAIEKLVFGPKAVVANDAQTAAISAVMDEKVEVDRTRMLVLVRPFV
jgi:hypothetical protein